MRNARERGARVIAVAADTDPDLLRGADYVVRVPDAPLMLSPFLAVAALDHLARAAAFDPCAASREEPSAACSC
jgi:DNA-binding MurR/RpiR family transcriptional regulator